jgi:UDP-N-acetylglucosamine 2-epimerase
MMNSMKICFVYSNRSESSLLLPFINYFKQKLEVKVLDLSKKIKLLENDSNLSKVYTYCYQNFQKNDYDFICILGDRRELPFISLAALFLDQKLVHLGAGEYVEGMPTYDQQIRPTISFFSNIQITFSKQATQNIKKLFSSTPFLKIDAFSTGNPSFRDIDIKKLIPPYKEKYDLVLLHPQSLSKKNTIKDLQTIKKQLRNKKTIFIHGNRDKHYDLIEKFYNELKSQKRDYHFIKSTNKKKYFSLIKFCDKFYTNTSGISEITKLNYNCHVNIGERNKNRSPMEFNDNAPELLYKFLKKRM